MSRPETGADASREAAEFLAGFMAVSGLRPHTDNERAAARKARAYLAGTGLYIPDWLSGKSK